MHTSLRSLQIQENVPLAPHTTLGVGGPARFFAVLSHESQIPDAMEFVRLRGCPLFILGGGSNIVVSDSGYSGLVLKMDIGGIQPLKEIAELDAGAGMEWDGVVQYCADRNLAGIECLSGIPGTVGGVPIQNVGAYGQEVGEVISEVRAWDRETGHIRALHSRECHFAYRSSIFNGSCAGRYIILKVRFRLLPQGAPCLQYADLRKRFGAAGRTPGLREVRDAVLEIRKAKAMVVRAEDPDSKSAGSFFRNPLLSPLDFGNLEASMRAQGLVPESGSVPCFDTPEGSKKIPAAWLIECAGFPKGYISGRAGISGKHSLALINRGGATAQDIITLMHRIQDRVQALFHIALQPEPIFIGFGDEVR